MEATGTTLIEAEPRAVLEWILDLERYRQADPKVGPVKEPVRLDEEGLGRVRYRGRLVGVPTPVDTQDVHLERWHRLTLTGASGVWTRWFVEFEGTFECERAGSGTQVTHREHFRFKPRPLGWLMDRLLGRWLAGTMPGEMTRLAQLIEQDVANHSTADLTATTGVEPS